MLICTLTGLLTALYRLTLLSSLTEWTVLFHLFNNNMNKNNNNYYNNYYHCYSFYFIIIIITIIIFIIFINNNNINNNNIIIIIIIIIYSRPLSNHRLTYFTWPMKENFQTS